MKMYGMGFLGPKRCAARFPSGSLAGTVATFAGLRGLAALLR
jgi:hypothetical protein